MRWTVLLLAGSIARPALGDESKVPDFARNKRRMEGSHREGNHIEGVPAIGYDPNVGVLLGALGYFAMDGTKKDPLFAVTPYRHRFYAQTLFSTLGFQQHVLSYDGIYIGDSPYRLRAQAVFERNINANYFGIAAMGPLEFQGKTHDTFDEQTNAASALQGGVASPLYNHYHYDKPSGSLTLERTLLGGLVRVQYGAVSTSVWRATTEAPRREKTPPETTRRPCTVRRSSAWTARPAPSEDARAVGTTS